MTDQTRDERIEEACERLRQVRENGRKGDVCWVSRVYDPVFTGKPTWESSMAMDLETVAYHYIDNAASDTQTITQLQKQVEKLESQLAAVREFREHLHYEAAFVSGRPWRYEVLPHYVNQLDAALREAGRGEANG